MLAVKFKSREEFRLMCLQYSGDEYISIKEESIHRFPEKDFFVYLEDEDSRWWFSNREHRSRMEEKRYREETPVGLISWWQTGIYFPPTSMPREHYYGVFCRKLAKLCLTAELPKDDNRFFRWRGFNIHYNPDDRVWYVNYHIGGDYAFKVNPAQGTIVPGPGGSYDGSLEGYRNRNDGGLWD